MPSTQLGNQSGGQNILSGSYLIGRLGLGNPAVGGVQLRLDITGGRAYVGLSGGVTVQSGGFTLSGGYLDGIPMASGDTYFIPRLGLGISGVPQVFVATDAAASGLGRMYWEIY